MKTQIKVIYRDDAHKTHIRFYFSDNKERPILSKRDSRHAALLKSKSFNAKLGELVYAGSSIFTGLGPKSSYLPRYSRKAVSLALSFVHSLRLNHVIVDGRQLDESSIKNIVYAVHVFMHKNDEFKSKSGHGNKEQCSVDILLAKGQARHAAYAAKIAEAVNFARDIDNKPANVATPAFMANTARALAKKKKLKYRLISKSDMKRLGMNALLSVSYGSARDPTLSILEYQAKGAKKTVAVVGKGITFDSGGISLKPSKAMDEMKFDKSGACAVLGVMKAVAELRPHVNVIGVLPCTENMPGGRATKPGDIVKAYNGKTIEILNTDAEGRMILADSLAYTEHKYKPNYIIDIATLTGACVVALGSFAMGMMSNDDDFAQLFINAGKNGFEEAWQLPLWEEYKEMMKSKIADIKNISGTHEAGTITAGAFLSNFILKSKWVHIDIAGTAWRTRSIPPVDIGATGSGVPIILDAIKRIAESK